MKKGVLQPGDRFVTEREAAEFLAASKATLNYWRVTGKGPRFYKHGRSVRYLLSDLAAWGTSRPVEPQKARTA